MRFHIQQLPVRYNKPQVLNIFRFELTTILHAPVFCATVFQPVG